MTRGVFLSILVIALLLPLAVQADDTEDFTVECVVVDNVSITVVNSLNFGTIVSPGANTTIAYDPDGTLTDPSSIQILAGHPAEFDIAGYDGLTFTAQLFDPAPAGCNMDNGTDTILVDTWLIDDDLASKAGGVNITPGNTTTFTLSNPGGTRTLYVGATAHPNAGISAGSYVDTMQLDVAFP